MAYNNARPADDDYISAGPEAIRENQRALKEDGIINAGTLSGKAAGNASGQIPINNGTKCTNLNADKLDDKDASEFAGASHGHNVATANSDGFMSNTDKQKLDGISAGATGSQNAIYGLNIQTSPGSGIGLLARSSQDIIEFIPGANIALTPDSTNQTLTIGVTGTVPSASSAATASNASALGGNSASYYAAASHTSHTGESSNQSASAGYKVFADGFKIVWGWTNVNANSSVTLYTALAVSNIMGAFVASNGSESHVAISTINSSQVTLYNNSGSSQQVRYLIIGY